MLYIIKLYAQIKIYKQDDLPMPINAEKKF